MSTQLTYADRIPPQREEIKAFAIAALLGNDTYRQVHVNIAERFKESVSTGTLHAWFHEDPDRVAGWASHQVKAMLERNLRTSARVNEILEDRIESETDLYKLNAVKGTAEDKVIALMRIAQDTNRTNTLQTALRAALGQPITALLAEAASITDEP